MFHGGVCAVAVGRIVAAADNVKTKIMTAVDKNLIFEFTKFSPNIADTRNFIYKISLDLPSQLRRIFFSVVVLFFRLRLELFWLFLVWGCFV